MEITESALSEHHPGEKQYTGERTSEPHRRSVAYKNGGRWKQRENGAMRVTIGASMIAQRGERASSAFAVNFAHTNVRLRNEKNGLPAEAQEPAR